MTMGSSIKYGRISTNQPDANSNPNNHNPTTKQHAIVTIPINK